jgi:signal transduction histidine kinase
MEQLKKAYDHALESDKMKTAFIQNVSHEIRTPLNVICGFTQVISDPELATGIEDRQKMADMMQKNARVITSLIDEMLELSNSESAIDAVKEDQVEVNEVLRDLMQENEGLLSKETVLRFESSLSEDYVITTNELMLKRIVNSLIDNAIKNTPKGTVTLRVAADKDNLTLMVEDTGKGIPAAEAEHIFERFFKLDSFKEGLGLGLPLCRSMTERLGGTVRLDTTYHHGARFIVTLPL